MIFQSKETFSAKAVRHSPNLVDTFRAMYGEDRVCLAKAGELFGARIKPGDIIALIDGSRGKLYCPRAKLYAILNDVFYLRSDDGRNKDIEYASRKTPLIIIKLDEKPVVESPQQSNFEAIRLYKNTVSKLVKRSDYALQAEYPLTNLTGRFYGVAHGRGDGAVSEVVACFSSICYCMGRSKSVYATPLSDKPEALLAPDELRSLLAVHSIEFDEEIDTYLEDGIVMLGIPLKEQFGERVKVVRLASTKGRENIIQLNNIMLASHDSSNSRLYYADHPMYTLLRNEFVALIRLNRSSTSSNTKSHNVTPEIEKAIEILNRNHIGFNPDRDTYLVNGKTVHGVPFNQQIMEEVGVVSFLNTECRIELHCVKPAGISHQLRLEYDGLVGYTHLMNRGIALIRFNR